MILNFTKEVLLRKIKPYPSKNKIIITTNIFPQFYKNFKIFFIFYNVKFKKIKYIRTHTVQKE